MHCLAFQKHRAQKTGPFQFHSETNENILRHIRVMGRRYLTYLLKGRRTEICNLLSSPHVWAIETLQHGTSPVKGNIQTYNEVFQALNNSAPIGDDFLRIRLITGIIMSFAGYETFDVDTKLIERINLAMADIGLYVVKNTIETYPTESETGKVLGNRDRLTKLATLGIQANIGEVQELYEQLEAGIYGALSHSFMQLGVFARPGAAVLLILSALEYQEQKKTQGS